MAGTGTLVLPAMRSMTQLRATIDRENVRP